MHIIQCVLVVGFLPFISGYKVGSTYIFRNMKDKSVITVQSDGRVTTEVLKNSPEQKWTVVAHPKDSGALELKQAVKPYNELSGYEESMSTPGLFPRPFTLVSKGLYEKVETWNLRVRKRWCLAAIGAGYPLDRDDCEDFTAPWQLWQLEEVK